jgi:hypothetical protein
VNLVKENCEEKGLIKVTKEELFEILGHQDIEKDLDVKTLVLDLIRDKLTQEEIHELFWKHLGDLDQEFVRGYFYRRFS